MCEALFGIGHHIAATGALNSQPFKVVRRITT
jgi:hypothetical protein